MTVSYSIPPPAPGGGMGASGTFNAGAPPLSSGPDRVTGAPVAVGTYIVGALVVVSLSGTRFAPVVGTFLIAAIVYNGMQILGKKG